MANALTAENNWRRLEMIKVIKRDGRTVDFDWSKITDAILKAY